MIGVIANSSDHEVVREFFELFKTPWEFYRRDRKYEVLLSNGEGQYKEATAKLIVSYNNHSTKDSSWLPARICLLSYQGNRIPIYRGCKLFPGKERALLVEEKSGAPASSVGDHYEGTIVSLGYDLFAEMRFLLGIGQPVEYASCPTLDLHIALLRDTIVGAGIPLVEIPPVPEGHRFVACLTHDVDHPSIRKHKFDHTMFGFFYRATLVSLAAFFRGRMPFRDLCRNLLAACKLPLVYLNVAEDFWAQFDDYRELEDGAPSSFFVMPFAGISGQTASGKAPSMRAARYRAADISGKLKALIASGCEVGLHGIDAWIDSSRGKEELAEICKITEGRTIGVRSHWLYNDQESAVVLENAGADYDSTVGYNETIGYRAGTMQAYKPLSAIRLLELPLHIMDTALFYPSYLNLSGEKAMQKVETILVNAVHFGGCVTVNWHDRSIAPERLWGEFYKDLVWELKTRGAWFATGQQSVSWFRKRRAAQFQTVTSQSGVSATKFVLPNENDGLPGLTLRIHNEPKPQSASTIGAIALQTAEKVVPMRRADHCHISLALS